MLQIWLIMEKDVSEPNTISANLQNNSFSQTASESFSSR